MGNLRESTKKFQKEIIEEMRSNKEKQMQEAIRYLLQNPELSIPNHIKSNVALILDGVKINELPSKI